jgi:tetratricopeptide (TPR) repeat protein
MAAYRSRFSRAFVSIAALFLLLSAHLFAKQSIDDKMGTVTVNLRLPDGSSFDRGAVVDLCTFTGSPLGIGTMRAGQVFFSGLPPGRYTVEVIAPGFQKASEPAVIQQAGERIQVYVTMVPEGKAPDSTEYPNAPVLAPNAQKELNKVLDAFRANKPEEAKKHLDKLARVAPANPDVNYVWGMYYLQRQDWANAKIYWEKAVQIYPRHVFSLGGLGQLAIREGNLPAAIDYLTKAVEASPSAWHLHERLAEAYLLHGDFELAEKQAEQSIELGKNRATRAQLILGEVLRQRNDRNGAQKALNALLAEEPSVPLAEQARKVLNEMSQSSQVVASATPQPVSAPAAAGTKAADASVFIAELVPPQKWMPPDVDESVPPVEAGVACPLQQIQEETGKRVGQFVDAVNRITATESLDHETIDRYGFSSGHQSRHYAYVASVQESRPGAYRVEEFRNGTNGLDIFPGNLATLGLPSLVMIFHPAYRNEYDVSCEGLSRWHGGLAWQVHFRQKPDQPIRLREYSVGHQLYPVALRGRAWIAANTFQVVSLETDILAPIPQIRLNAEHISVEYMPVKFRKSNQELWLPQSAELFFDFGGRRMHRRHNFSNYLLFSVDEDQKISEPSAATADSAPAASSSPTPNF